MNRPSETTTAILASIGDPEGTRTISAIVALLIALGVALLLIAVWVYRTTRPDPELLAPLEAMGERKWRRGDPVWQRRRLDELRPEGATPLEPSVAPPELDESYDLGPHASGFDDLQPVDDTSAATTDDDLVAPPGDDGRVAADDQHPIDGHDAGATPVGVDRPEFDDVPDGDFDEEALAIARADLEQELSGAAEQLDLFSEQEPSSNG